ncbi:MAG: hypothetical protein GXO23_03250 [Crenarchaeota archaeon]|nr:hypothetical protein [Thermoproteota archaeon]
MFDLLRRYGKYLGGIDYEKIEQLIASEDERLRMLENALLSEFTEKRNLEPLRDRGTFMRNVLELEKRRLQTKLEMLKKREKDLTEMLVELKTRPGVTLYEINKLVREIKRTRREIRRVKKLLKYLDYSSMQV